MMHYGFHIDLPSSDDVYLFIDVDSFSVVIKREADGIVVDIYPLHGADEPIASTWALHAEAEHLQPINNKEAV